MASSGDVRLGDRRQDVGTSTLGPGGERGEEGTQELFVCACHGGLRRMSDIHVESGWRCVCSSEVKTTREIRVG